MAIRVTTFPGLLHATNSRGNSSRPTNTQVVKPDRGYSAPPASTAAQRTNSGPTTAPRPAGAFEGAGNNGQAERVSSQRGAASAQGRRGNQ